MVKPRWRYADLTFSVASRIRFADGHFEDGPNTSLQSRVDTVEAKNQLVAMLEKTVASLLRRDLLSELLAPFREVFVVGDGSRQQINITYRISYDLVVTMEDWSTLSSSDSQEYTRPI